MTDKLLNALDSVLLGKRDSVELLVMALLADGHVLIEDVPGTGFFVRNSESHSYRRFVIAAKKRSKQNWWTLLSGKEPNFDKENKRIEEAFAKADNDKVKQILSSYQNVIGLAKDEELLQRIN